MKLKGDGFCAISARWASAGAHGSVMGEGGGVETGPLDLAFAHADEPALQHFEWAGSRLQPSES